MDTVQPTKFCSKCKQEKPTSEFGSNGPKKGGLKPWCKPCIREYQRNYQRSEEYKVKHRARRKVLLEERRATPTAQPAEKQCGKCGLVKPVARFHRLAAGVEERRSDCKDCHNVASNEYGKTEKQKAYKRAYGMKWRQTEAYQSWLASYLASDEVRERKREILRQHGTKYHNRSRAQDPIPYRARDAINKAVRRGKLQKPVACSRCHRSGITIHAHHEDYSRPLDVVWVCQRCHLAIHGRNAYHVP